MKDVEVYANLKVTDMKNSVITGFIYNDKKYILNDNGKPKMETVIENNKREYQARQRYDNKIDKWIKKNNIQVFRFDDLQKIKGFRKDHMEHYISKMIQDKTLLQVGSNKFKVCER